MEENRSAEKGNNKTGPKNVVSDTITIDIANAMYE
jgi:hypothetical protein